MLRLLFCFSVLLPLTACDVPVVDTESAQNPSVSFEPGGPTTTTQKKPPAQEDFASVDEAFNVLAAATEAGQREQQMAAYNWLCRQGEGAVPAATAVMNDAGRSMEVRRLACGVLSKLGPKAVPALLEASRSEERLLQLKAIETMPSIKPSTSEIVDRLIVLMEDPGQDVQVAAIKSLGGIGTPAQRAGDKLIAMQNNPDLTETVRDAAAASLRKVNPRKTFND